MLSRITYLLVKSDVGSCCLQREKGQQKRGNICRRIVGSEGCVFKAQNPMKPCQELERNERQCFRTKQRNGKQVSCVYYVPKNNSAESKPAGFGWECCGLACPTELNWNALFVFQQAYKGWQSSGQLFKPCWRALRIQFVYLVRGPVEKLRVKQVVFEQCVEWVYSAWKKNVCCLRKMCPRALFWSRGLLCK